MQQLSRPGLSRPAERRLPASSQAAEWERRRRRAATTTTAASSSSKDSSAASSSPSSSAPAATTTTTTSTPPRIECMEAGMDVYCVIVDDENPAASGAPATPAALAAAASASSSDAASDAESAPLTAKLLRAAVLVSPFFFWGTSMVAMKGVGPHATPLLLGAMRLLPAGAALVAWASAQGRPQPSTPLAWAWVSAFALVDGAAFQGFLAQGLERTSAGLGSVIIDSQPLTVAVLAALLFGETLGAGGVVGLGLGVLGLLLLEVPADALSAMLHQGDLASAAAGAGATGAADAAAAAAALVSSSSSSSSSSSASWSLLDSGEFWMLLAAQSMALGTVMVRYVTKHADPVMATGWHMLLGGGVLLAAALATGGDDLPARLSQFSASDAAAMAYVSMLGGAASYGVFFLEASRGSLTQLSSLTFLTPVFAAAGDYVVRGATLTPAQLLGAGVALGGVALVSGGSGGGGGKGGKDKEGEEEKEKAA